MKLKISILVIILATAAIIGVINLSLNRSIKTDEPTTITDGKPSQDLAKPLLPKKGGKIVTGQQDNAKKDALHDDDIIAEFAIPSDDKDIANLDTGDLSKEDVEKINSIVKLTESELAKELDALKTRIESDNLFDKLEDGELSEAQELEAKNTLERFALLGLEQTRRKYMSVEPELKNPYLAYKDSIHEIRAFLNDEEDDEDDEEDDDL